MSQDFSSTFNLSGAIILIGALIAVRLKIDVIKVLTASGLIFGQFW